MIRKKNQGFLCGILVIALILTAACISPAEAPAAKGTGGALPTGGATHSPATSTSRGQTMDVPVTVPSAPVPAAPLLGTPTDHAVTVSVLPSESLAVFLEYRQSSGSVSQKTSIHTVITGVPAEIPITDLDPDTAYTYRVCWRRPGAAVDQCSPDYQFHTQRSPGSPFVFAVQADSHLDERSSGALYNRTLGNELAGGPDFLIDLGDTFMTEKLALKDTGTVRAQYLRQRSYLGTIGHSVPLFLALGNHDGETGYPTGGAGNDLAALSLGFRKQYFPNPEPDGFYTGNSENTGLSGTKEDYYAWQWGDAQFIVLDPYWYTPEKPGGKTDGWGWTLGKTQYQWLGKTLDTSRSKYIFVFAHQLVGGDPQGRGGTEFASGYEWGGENSDGTPGFDQHRPEWGVPIHQMLVEHNVTAFFHGHDHFYARQELDGVTYQEVPQPATAGSSKGAPGSEYGYVSGILLQSPGHLRVTISPESARIDYISSALAGEGRGGRQNGAVADTYTLDPRANIPGV